MPTVSIGTGLRPALPRVCYKRLVIEHTIRRSPLFNQLNERDIERLCEAGALRSLQKSEHLFHNGNPCTNLYIVNTGAVRLYRINSKGHEQVLHVARPGESFGEEALFSSTGHAFSAAAVQNSGVVILPRAEILGIMSACPELSLSLLRALSVQFRQTVRLLEDLRLRSVRSRLAQWLLDHANGSGAADPHVISLSVPKSVLAAELGMASETFSRTLAEFQMRRLIEVRGKVLIILSLEGLESEAQNVDSGKDSQLADFDSPLRILPSRPPRVPGLSAAALPI